MGKYASGKHALAISDRSGMVFPYPEMVREWNGSLVHISEYEPKQPQLEPKPVGSDPQALFNPRPQPASKTSLTLLGPNPFTTVLVPGVTTYVNVFSPDRSGELERRYESEMLRALDADNQGTSSFISPQTFYGDGV